MARPYIGLLMKRPEDRPPRDMYAESVHAHSLPSAAALAWVSELAKGRRILATEILPGGTSHSNCVIRLDRSGERRVVLRRWIRPVGQDDFTVEREAAALALLEQRGFAAPRLLAADPRGERCGAPALLMTCVPGRPPGRRIAPSPRALEQLAAAALALHRIAGPWPGIPAYRPYHDLRDPRPPGHSIRPDLWERAFTVVAGAPPLEREAFIHRDYHPGNTLWLRGRLIGVVDWSTASVGPAGVDLGHMRWNLVLRNGEQHADGFLRSYCASRGEGYVHHPYWDVRALVDLLPDADLDGASRARLEPYLERLIARC